MTDMLLLLTGAALANNAVLAQLLGVSAVLGTSDNIARATAMAIITMVVASLASLLLWPLNNLLLQPFGLGFLRLLAYLLVIAVIAIGGMLLLRSYRPLWHRSLDPLLPLVMVNSAVVGAVLANDERQHGFFAAIAYGFGTAAGFALVVVLLAALRERLAVSDAPSSLQGTGITLLTIALMSLAFMGLAGSG